MMGWSVTILRLRWPSSTRSPATSRPRCWSRSLIQVAYILKFFYWESGYFGSLDIMHDRFGYYICWGVLCWIPGVYTLVTLTW